MTIVVDTLAITKRLKDAGYTDQQAEAQAELWAEMIDETLATKRDLRDLEYRLISKLGTIVVITAGVLFALLRLTGTG